MGHRFLTGGPWTHKGSEERVLGVRGLEMQNFIAYFRFACTVKLVCNDHLRDLNFVAVVDWYSKLDSSMVVAVGKWSLFGGVR